MNTLIESFKHGRCHEGNDLQSGVGGGTLRDGLESVLAFLVASTEAYCSHFRGRPSGNGDIFPDFIEEWAYQVEYELAMLRCMVDEARGCIEED